MKIIISAQIDVAPDKREHVLSEANSVIEQILQQIGCVRYDWAADSRVSGRIIVYEEWESTDALDGHFSGPGFKKMNQLLTDVGVISAASKKFGVSHEGKVFDTDGVATSSFA